MKTIKYSNYGDSSVIKIVNLKIPELKSDELLIKMYASSVSPSDVAMRKGKPFISRFFIGLLAPKVTPGDLVAGVVEAVGSDTHNFTLGDRVYGSAGSKMGAHAEYLKIKSTEAITKLPDNVTFEIASSLTDGGITAYPFLVEVGDIKAGQHILINGGSGSVGTYAIQLAKYFGAKVTTVSSSKNMTLLKSLGADFTIDYNKEDFTQNKNSYNIIFDVVGKSSYKECKSALTTNGIYMSTFPNTMTMIRSLLNKFTKKKCKFKATGLRKANDKIKDYIVLSKLASSGTLKTIIDKRYSFDDIKKAHDYVELGHKVGNVILKIR